MPKSKIDYYPGFINPMYAHIDTWAHQRSYSDEPDFMQVYRRLSWAQPNDMFILRREPAEDPRKAEGWDGGLLSKLMSQEAVVLAPAKSIYEVWIVDSYYGDRREGHTLRVEAVHPKDAEIIAMKFVDRWSRPSYPADPGQWMVGGVRSIGEFRLVP